MIPKQSARVNTQYDEINRNIDTAWDKGLPPDFTINPFSTSVPPLYPPPPNENIRKPEVSFTNFKKVCI